MTIIDFNTGDNHGLSKFHVGVYKYISLPECLYITISATNSFRNVQKVKVAGLSLMLKGK
jgi:hypothetical protein